ncbi:MAG: hypothetical protein O8C55_05395 [Candidatus Methanoperedens sp.]|nr:hypothetical protein [Candidatus Methanoperedens sp.]
MFGASEPGLRPPEPGGVLRRIAPILIENFGRSDHRSFWDAGIPAIIRHA